MPVDLRLLGWARRLPVSPLADALGRWTRAGIAVMLTTGPVLFLSDMPRYAANRAFRFKMGCLLLALVTHFTVRRRALRGSAASGRLAALLSLALWTCVVLGGRAIADFDL
ncbi:MAG: hypothetical protein LAP40_00755 [Acidobacteriia bacterium]|nr:hypothetical protein [Terriglobia bacterium]